MPLLFSSGLVNSDCFQSILSTIECSSQCIKCYTFLFSQFVDPMTGAKGYYPVVPATSYVQPTVQTVQPVQAVPQVSYVQAAPHTRTVYTADPMFFNFGRYFNNNLGGKVIIL